MTSKTYLTTLATVLLKKKTPHVRHSNLFQTFSHTNQLIHTYFVSVFTPLYFRCGVLANEQLFSQKSKFLGLPCQCRKFRLHSDSKSHKPLRCYVMVKCNSNVNARWQHCAHFILISYWNPNCSLASDLFLPNHLAILSFVIIVIINIIIIINNNNVQKRVQAFCTAPENGTAILYDCIKAAWVTKMKISGSLKKRKSNINV